jgi:hypothetical protein
MSPFAFSIRILVCKYYKLPSTQNKRSTMGLQISLSIYFFKVTGVVVVVVYLCVLILTITSCSYLVDASLVSKLTSTIKSRNYMSLVFI